MAKYETVSGVFEVNDNDLDRDWETPDTVSYLAM